MRLDFCLCVPQKRNGIITQRAQRGSNVLRHQKSTHPIAKAIIDYSTENSLPETSDIQEIAGKGLKGNVNGKAILVGNKKLMEEFGVSIPAETDGIVENISLG